MASSQKIAIIGLGNAGRTFASHLAQLGVRLAVWTRSASVLESTSADFRNHLPNADVAVEADLASAVRADVVLLAVSDDAIADVAQRIADLGAEPQVCLHLSGFHSHAVLEPLAEQGWSTGSLHPLMSFASGGKPLGAWFAITGDDRARGHARRIVERLEGHVLTIGETADAKRAYHAGAALLSNGGVALFDSAVRVAAQGEEPSKELIEAFAGLLRSTTNNLERAAQDRSPIEQALTGPVVRGDRDVVKGHLDAIGDERDLYVALTRRMVRLALQRGALTEAQASDIESLLD